MSNNDTLPVLPPLVTMGDPRLAQPSTPVQQRRIRKAEFQERLALLAACMRGYQGIGIAAPQIGWFQRVFLMMQDDGTAETLLTFINAELVWQSEEQNWAWEGCLSVPGLRGWICRPAAVSVRGVDAQGAPLSMEFTGWNARVFQHEFDHLEGMLFPYRASDARYLVSLEALAYREQWSAQWPAPGARDTPFGALYRES